MNPEKTSMSWSHANSWKTRKYLNQGSSFNLRRSVFYPPLCPLTASIGMYYSFISLQCSISASVGRFFSQILNLLRYIQIATKSRISNLANSKGRKAHEGCPDSPRPHTSGPRQSDFFRSLFVFFPEVRKEKKRFCIFFFLNWGVNLSRNILI